MSGDITLPYNYKPRSYQKPLFQAIDSGIKRAVCVWHRRAGKDKTLLNLTFKKMWERVGAYYYFLPTYKQGKKIIWKGIDKTGFKFIDHMPKQLISRIDNTEMSIETANGSLFQVIGTDNIDSIVGTNPIGCVFSEYSLQDPQAWEFIRPILKENGGWAIFNFTPRGNNHAKKLFDMASKNEKWFCQLLTINKTFDFEGKNLVTEQDINEERVEGMPEELIQQEYYCSFEAGVVGAYYSQNLSFAREQNRITKVPYDSQLPVFTVWDLGIDDCTSIGFFQKINKEVRMIDYIEENNQGLNFYVKELKTKPYVYAKHFAPHDIKVREFTSGVSRLETARKLGINFDIIPKVTISEGIDVARRFFSRLWIDENNCERFIDCVTNYKKEYDEKNKCFKDKPKHDWSSHGADVLRYTGLVEEKFINEYETYNENYYEEQNSDYDFNEY